MSGCSDCATHVLLNGNVVLIESIRAVPAMLGVRDVRVRVERDGYSSAASLQVAVDDPTGETVSSNDLRLGSAADR